MTSVDDLLDERPGPHYGYQSRYLLRLPLPYNDAKAKLRTRMTTFIKTLDESDGLIPWSMVTNMRGMSMSPALRAEWAALLARYPDPYYDCPESKGKAKDIAERAKEAGGGGARRDTGTALHDIFNAVVTGRAEVGRIDAEFRWHVEAMLAALDDAGYDPIPEWCERSVYVARYDIVGSFDCALRRRADNAVVIGDVKTGGEHWSPKKDHKSGLQTGWYDAHEMSDLKESAQLAGYASADHLIEWPADKYEPCGLVPMPPFDQSEGVVIHAPSTARQVALRRLDLETGRRALEMAAAMREMRRAKPLIERIGDGPPPVPGIAAPATVEDPFRGLPSAPVERVVLPPARNVVDHGDTEDLLAGLR